MKEIKKNRLIATYSRRGARPLTDKRRDLFNTLLPEISIKLPVNLENISHIFKFSPDEIWLEIGFGGGEHIAKQAEANPNIGLIGCEVFTTGVSSLLNSINEKKISNIRIFQDDARLLLDALPDESINRIFILFPDPWPKRKHHKRRLIQESSIQTLSRVMKKGGKLRFASDHMQYIAWTLALMAQNKDFDFAANTAADWLNPPKDHFTTRYQIKKKTGDEPIFLDFIKNS